MITTYSINIPPTKRQRLSVDQANKFYASYDEQLNYRHRAPKALTERKSPGDDDNNDIATLQHRTTACLTRVLTSLDEHSLSTQSKTSTTTSGVNETYKQCHDRHIQAIPSAAAPHPHHHLLNLDVNTIDVDFALTKAPKATLTTSICKQSSQQVLLQSPNSSRKACKSPILSSVRCYVASLPSLTLDAASESSKNCDTTNTHRCSIYVHQSQQVEAEEEDNEDGDLFDKSTCSVLSILNDMNKLNL